MKKNKIETYTNIKTWMTYIKHHNNTTDEWEWGKLIHNGLRQLSNKCYQPWFHQYRYERVKIALSTSVDAPGPTVSSGMQSPNVAIYLDDFEYNETSVKCVCTQWYKEKCRDCRKIPTRDGHVWVRYAYDLETERRRWNGYEVKVNPRIS